MPIYKYTKKHRKSKTKFLTLQKGGVLPPEITHDVYMQNKNSEQRNYTRESYHKLLPEVAAAEKMRNNERQRNNLRRKKEQLLQKIQDHRISEISPEEYALLEPDEKKNWELKSMISPDNIYKPSYAQTHIDFYQRRPPQADTSAILAKQKITTDEYKQLSPKDKKLYKENIVYFNAYASETDGYIRV
jgi:hypothetical protein